MASTTTNNQVAKLGDEQEILVGESLYTKALRRLRQDRLTIVAAVTLFALLGASLLAPVYENVVGVSYRTTNPRNTFQEPSFYVLWNQEVREEANDPESLFNSAHILGTDDIGRDHVARLLYAGQITMAIAFFAATLSLVIGVALGIIAGFYGGIVDDILMWFVATITSIPSLFLLLIVSSVFRPGPTTLVLVLGLIGWPLTTRLVRGETLSLREREFVISARAMGASNFRIMYNHIMPNLISIVVISLAIDIGTLMLVEAALSFLGFGVQPPTPTWGNMLTNAQTFFTSGPWLVIAPGLLITTAVLCLYVIGDGVRDAFDPTSTK